MMVCAVGRMAYQAKSEIAKNENTAVVEARIFGFLRTGDNFGNTGEIGFLILMDWIKYHSYFDFIPPDPQ